MWLYFEGYLWICKARKGRIRILFCFRAVAFQSWKRSCAKEKYKKERHRYPNKSYKDAIFTEVKNNVYFTPVIWNKLPSTLAYPKLSETQTFSHSYTLVQRYGKNLFKKTDRIMQCYVRNINCNGTSLSIVTWKLIRDNRVRCDWCIRSGVLVFDQI